MPLATGSKKLLSISLSLTLLFHSIPLSARNSIGSVLTSNASQAKHQADQLFESSFSEPPVLDPEPMPIHLEASYSQDPSCINSGKPCNVTKEGPPDTPKTSGGDSGNKGPGTCVNCGGSNSDWNPKDGDEAFIGIYEGLGKVAAGGAMVLAMLKGLAIATKETFLSSWSWGLITTIGLAGLGILLFSSLLGPMTFGLFQTIFTFGFIKTPSKDKNHPERRALWILGYLAAKAASALFLLNTLGLMSLPFSLPFNLPGLSTGLGKALAGYAGLQVLEMPISLIKHAINANKPKPMPKAPPPDPDEVYRASQSIFKEMDTAVKAQKAEEAQKAMDQKRQAIDQEREELSRDVAGGLLYKPVRIKYVNGAALLEETCNTEGNCQPNKQGPDKRYPNDQAAINKLLETKDFVKATPFTLWTPAPSSEKEQSPTQTTSGYLRERQTSNGSLYHHAGLDIQAPRGAAVVSATNGKVLFAGYYRTNASLNSTDEEVQRKADIINGLGNMVVLQPEGQTTALDIFQHLGEKNNVGVKRITLRGKPSWIATTADGSVPGPNDTLIGPISGKDCRHGMDQDCESGIYVSPGQQVKPGDPLGKIGNTGRILGSPDRGDEIGSHLHWGRVEVDPTKNERMDALRTGTWDKWASKNSPKEVGRFGSEGNQKLIYTEIQDEFFKMLEIGDTEKRNLTIRNFIAQATADSRGYGVTLINPWLSRVENPK
ncbi:MAG: hypothetical protein HY401_07325 [Elusimicrobia bacterium]|nr:hypothetical protein [Elusimicrobiota bacterium]